MVNNYNNKKIKSKKNAKHGFVSLRSCTSKLEWGDEKGLGFQTYIT